MIRKALNTFKSQLRFIRYSQVTFFRFSNKPDFKLSDEVLNKLKKDATEFYEKSVANPQSLNFDLESIEQWQTEIIESEIPVVIQMTASWCQPCKRLSPILSKQADQSQGKWKLVRVDIDKHSQIATELQIQSVPTVILVYKGNSYDGFVGIPNQQKLQKFFEGVNQLANPSEEDKKSNQIFNDLGVQFQGQDYKGVEEKCLEILKDKNFKKYRYVVHYFLMRSYLQLGILHKADEQTKILETQFAEDINSQMKEELSIYKKELEEKKALKKDNNSLNELLIQLDKDPANLELRLQIIKYTRENQLFEEAIQHCLDMIKVDPQWQNGIAKQNLLEIFGELGSSNNLVIEGRKKLQRLLF